MASRPLWLKKKGKPLAEVLEAFNTALHEAKFVVGQNVDFDINIMGAEFFRANLESPLTELPILDTCTEKTAKLCQIAGGRGGGFKLPTLTELHEFLFNEPFNEAHNATADVEATSRCFLELIRKAHFSEDKLQAEPGYVQAFQDKHPQPIPLVGLKHINLKKASEAIAKAEPTAEDDKPSRKELDKNLEQLSEETFVHLHNHSQYSILQSTISVIDLIKPLPKTICQPLPSQTTPI